MSEPRPTTVDSLYLDAELLVLTTESRPLAARDRVTPTGPPFAGFPGNAPAPAPTDRT
ncbi:hypothetical protein ACFWFB_32500 [Streptomyces albidoflavus]